jgi:parallel beta-helix repeat protein
MTTWYFDAVNGLDANDGLTPDTAKQTYNPGISATSDTFLFKRGVTQIVTTPNQWIQNGASATVRARYGAYGVAQVPYSIWKYGAASGNMILNGARSKYIDFEDMYFDMRSTDCRNSIYFASQTTNETVGNSIRRCFFQGSNSPTLHIGSGLQIVQETASSAWPRDYEIEDCHFFDNDSHGLVTIGSRNIAVRRCKFYRNGANDPNGGHGFSSRYNYTAASSGWTNTATTVWQRTLTGAETNVYYVKTSVGAYPRMRLTAGTQTAPGVGEFGVVGGILYINVNSASNPSGQAVVYAWGICNGLLIEDNESYDNYWNQAAPFHEGHGYAFDDWADDSFFYRNKSYNNQGAGFSINRGDRNRIVGNIAYGNWQAAVVLNPSDDTVIAHNTCHRNNAGTGAHAGEVFSWGNSKSAVISNNILVSTVAFGISRESTDTGFSGSNNCISGHLTAAEKNASVTGTVAVDPNLDEVTFRPKAAQLIRAGTYLGGKDYNGKQFYNPPNIGAVDDVTATPRQLFRR